jgi:DnaJ-class molecular chaperone
MNNDNLDQPTQITEPIVVNTPVVVKKVVKKAPIEWRNQPEVKVKPVVCEFCQGGLIRQGAIDIRCARCQGTGKTI